MRSLMVLIATLFAINSVVAQDLLVKRNGEQMRVKVLKITKKKVQFVRQGTELPIYTLPVSDIDYIEYPLGDRDTFGKDKSEEVRSSVAANKEVQTTPEIWHGSVPPPSRPPFKPVPYIPQEVKSEEKIYAIGDIYDKDGVKGIVALLYDGGRHGLIMSLDEACLAWCTLNRRGLKKAKTFGADSRTDGMANMRAIEKYIAEKGLSWSDFPAFEWCRNKGEGWFLPAINELWSAGTMYLGGSRTASNRKSRKNYNQNIELAGGTPVSNIMIYHSSTEESDPRYAFFSHMNSEPPYINSGYKADELFVRAFHKF